MKKYYTQIAVALAVLLAAPTLKEGISVISGNMPTGMVVLLWLVYYNLGMVLFSFLVIFFIWKKFHYRKIFTGIVLSGNVLVLLTLLTIFLQNEPVAIKSILAMTMRSSIWSIIFFMVYLDDKEMEKQKITVTHNNF